MDGIDLKAFVKMRETDLRARQMIDMAIAYGLQESGEPEDGRDYKKFAYDIASLAVTGLLKYIYENDGEIMRLRTERDYYKRIAEESLHLRPIAALILDTSLRSGTKER